MADIKPIKPIKLCVNITIPTIDDDSISLYECVGILGNKLQEAIQKINESLGSLEGAYTADNPPPYPVTSVNGKTGAVVIDIPANVYTEDNPPPYPVTSVNRAETKDVITVFEPEGGSIEDVSQAELIAACKAGARLGAFNQDDGTCRLYHFNLYIDPERVDYNEVAGGGASGVISVNGQTGSVNIFNAPISAATAESVTDLNISTNTKINQLKDEMVTQQEGEETPGEAPALNAGTFGGMTVTQFVDMIYPVGSIYISASATSPASLFGGEWAQINGRFLIGTGAPENNDDGISPGSYNYAAGAKGGEATHTLTERELPVLSGSVLMHGAGAGGTVVSAATGVFSPGGTESGYRSAELKTGASSLSSFDLNAGEGRAHNNLPPYLAVYMWQRTS